MKKLIIIPLIGLLTGGCISSMIDAANSGQRQDNYNKYVIASQQNNTQREEKGLPPEPIMSFNQWANQSFQPTVVTTNTVK
ncbi:MAG TPA: hypothetical protein VGN23_08855 [Verrucomicrobiae bacterium]|jgi:hypothetical protein